MAQADPTLSATRPTSQAVAIKRVLNAGCGYPSANGLYPAFRDGSWQEIRLDIDPGVKPDLVGSIADMTAVSDGSFDAVWCSHNLEHLHAHEIAGAVAEFHRVLASDGFALITCPDLEAVAELIVNGQAEDIAYQSAVGPITALDMLFGHSPSIERGNLYMAHKTGFTADRLGRVLVDGGFVEALIINGPGFDLWAVGLMPQTNRLGLLQHLQRFGLNFLPDG